MKHPIIYWAGDSTVKQNDITSYPQSGIGQGLMLYIKKGIFIDNRAENGRSSKSFIEEGRLASIAEDIQKDDFLFIEFGHNDEKSDAERHTDPYTTYQDYLTAYIQTALEKSAHPVLITSLYRRLFEKNGLLAENTHFDYPQAMKELGKKFSVPVIDLCSLSKELIQKTGAKKSKVWFMHLPPQKYSNYPDGKQDNSHLTYEGAVIFAGLIAKELRKLGGIYAELLIPEDAQKEDAFFLKD